MLSYGILPRSEGFHSLRDKGIALGCSYQPLPEAAHVLQRGRELGFVGLIVLAGKRGLQDGSSVVVN